MLRSMRLRKELTPVLIATARDAKEQRIAGRGARLHARRQDRAGVHVEPLAADGTEVMALGRHLLPGDAELLPSARRHCCR